MKAAREAKNKGPKPPLPNRCVLYYRESVLSPGIDAEIDESRQLEAMQSVAEQRNLSITASFSDYPVQVPIEDRPGFLAAYGMLRSGLASVLIVRSIAKLTRKAEDLIGFLKCVKEYGYRLILVDEDIDTATSRDRLWLLSMTGDESAERDDLAELAARGLI